MWTSFAAATGGAAAGLTGLTFIVVAIRFDELAISTEHRSRAAQILSMYSTITVVGVLMTVPQYNWALGAEMLLVALISAKVLSSLDSNARREQTTPSNAALTLALTVFLGCIALSGTLLLCGQHWAMFLYVVSAVIGLVLGVLGAWTFLTGGELKLVQASSNA